MNLNIIAEWVEIEIIQYLIIASVVLGLMLCIKWLVIGR